MFLSTVASNLNPADPTQALWVRDALRCDVSWSASDDSNN
jgi:hypothetical protein